MSFLKYFILSENNNEINNILFITLSNIGDVILTTPALESLHQQYPSALIDIVCDKRSAILFKYCPYIGRIILKEKRSGLSGLLNLVLQIRKKKYDLAVDLRTDGLLLLINSKIKIFKHSNNSTLHMHSAEKHYASLGKHISVAIPNSRIWLSKKELDLANLIFKDKSRILTIGLGANFSEKIWPAESYALLANSLEGFFDAILLVGNQQDAELAIIFKEKCKLPVINFCGKLDLLQTAALMGKSLFFIGNDSGLGHLASAVGLKSFTIFGIGQPRRYAPWSKSAMWYQDPTNNIKNVCHQIISEKIAAVLIQQNSYTQLN
jgi:ADP-heptose:LPS heptosyltransferase